MSFSPTKQFRLGTQHSQAKRRVKGTPNVSTGQAKAALHAVFESLGGVRGMTEWAMIPENRGEFYKLWSKLLPTEIDPRDSRIQVVILPANSTGSTGAAQGQALEIAGNDSATVSEARELPSPAEGAEGWGVSRQAGANEREPEL